MICPSCGMSIQVDRSTCPNCGVVLTQPQYTTGVGTQQTVYSVLHQEKEKKKTYRLIGLVLIIIGILLIPVVYITMFLEIGWFVCGGAFVCLMSGVIIMLTNLTKKYSNI